MCLPISSTKPIQQAPQHHPAVSERRPIRKVSSLLDSPLNKGLKETLNKKIKELKENETLEGFCLPPPAFLTPNETTLSSISKISEVPEIVQDFFEKLISWIEHINSEGIKETTIILNREPSSIFSGTKITLTEYSSAPKIFNLHLSSSPEAAKLFQAHAQALINAIHHRDFDIHRIDADLLSSEEFLIYRNPDNNQDQDDGQLDHE